MDEIQRWIGELNTGDDAARSNAASELASRALKGKDIEMAMPALRGALLHKNDYVRFFAIKAMVAHRLMKNEGKGDVNALFSAFPDVWLRRGAGSALASYFLTKNETGEVEKLLASNLPEVIYETASRLAWSANSEGHAYPGLIEPLISVLGRAINASYPPRSEKWDTNESLKREIVYAIASLSERGTGTENHGILWTKLLGGEDITIKEQVSRIVRSEARADKDVTMVLPKLVENLDCGNTNMAINCAAAIIYADSGTARKTIAMKKLAALFAEPQVKHANAAREDICTIMGDALCRNYEPIAVPLGTLLEASMIGNDNVEEHAVSGIGRYIRGCDSLKKLTKIEWHLENLGKDKAAARFAGDCSEVRLKLIEQLAETMEWDGKEKADQAETAIREYLAACKNPNALRATLRDAEIRSGDTAGGVKEMLRQRITEIENGLTALKRLGPDERRKPDTEGLQRLPGFGNSLLDKPAKAIDAPQHGKLGAVKTK